MSLNYELTTFLEHPFVVDLNEHSPSHIMVDILFQKFWSTIDFQLESNLLLINLNL
jgi:hypothetical protein